MKVYGMTRSIDSWLATRDFVRGLIQADNEAPVFVRLRVGGRLLRLDNVIPTTRAECPQSRPCGHVRCKEHLWVVEGEARPGRRGPERALPSDELRTAWLESPTPPSCALDEAERVPSGETRPIAEVAGALRLCERQAHTVLKRAVAKLRDHGTDLSELLART